MARAFVSASSQGMQSSTLSLSSFNQASVSFWLNWTTFATDDHLAMEYSPNANTNTGAFFFDPNASSGTGWQVAFRGGVGPIQANFSRPSAGAWHHFLIEMDGTQTNNASIPVVYVDGVSQSLTYAGSNTAGSFGNYNLNFMCRNQASLFGTGQMADVAIWAVSSGGGIGALLTALEAKALSQGIRPGAIRGASLRYWWPIDGIQSTEPDLGGTAQNATLTAAPTLAFGPPFAPLTPRWPQLSSIVVPASFQAAWAMRNRIVIDGIGI